MRRARWPGAFAVAALFFLLPACQSVPPVGLHPQRTGLLPDVARYEQAHRDSLLLRHNLADLQRSFPQELLTASSPSPWVLDRLRRHKREYFGVREVLFDVALLNASAIVETPEGHKLRSILLRASVSLLAGTDLVANFRAVGAILADRPAPRAMWNAAEPEQGIPPGSWDLALDVARNTAYQDLFKEAVERLKAYQPLLEAYREAGDESFLVLYPRGVAPALDEAEEGYAFLRARPGEPEELDQDEAEVRLLVERSKRVRAAWVVAGPMLREAIERDGGLIRGDVHVRLLATKREYLDLRERLYALSFKHAMKVTRPDLPYTRAFRMRAIGISLLAAVTLYGNAHHAQAEFLAIPGVRALLNQGDPALGIPPRFWDDVEREFARPEYRRLLEAGLAVFEREVNRPEAGSAGEEAFLSYVGREIAATVVIAEIRGEPYPLTMVRTLRYYVGRILELPGAALEAGKAGLSGGVGGLGRALGVGDVLGSLALRRGKLFGQPRWARFLRDRLEPGDLLVDRSPFTLTYQLIPGYFGHVALYVGTTEDLKRLELVTHPFVAPYLNDVAAGKTIIEALRTGTRIAGIEEFLNLDDLAILRPKRARIPHAHVLRAIALAFSHIGKQYDFRFDNNTWETIVCSELAFLTYVEVPWVYAKVLSSYTITPDDVAVFAGSGASRPFELVAFVRDGEIVHDRMTGVLDEASYIRVLGRRYDSAVR